MPSKPGATLTELMPKLKKMNYEDGVKTLTVRFVTRLEELRDWLRILNTEVAYSPEILQGQYNGFMNQILKFLGLIYSTFSNSR